MSRARAFDVHVPYSPSMRILIIGGTRFVGHGMAQAALDAGHDVTLLHRNADRRAARGHAPAGRPRRRPVGARRRLSWDATIDVCAYVPGQVRHLHEALGDRGGHHVFISTVSVYQEPARGRAPTRTHRSSTPASEDATEVTNETYGPLKVTCENVATELVRRRAGWRSSARRTSWGRAT